jgi:hypothetical protein
MNGIVGLCCLFYEFFLGVVVIVVIKHDEGFGEFRVLNWANHYFGFKFVTLFLGLSMPFYAINLDAVCLFTDSSFSFLALLNLC